MPFLSRLGCQLLYHSVFGHEKLLDSSRVENVSLDLILFARDTSSLRLLRSRSYFESGRSAKVSFTSSISRLLALLTIQLLQVVVLIL